MPSRRAAPSSDVRKPVVEPVKKQPEPQPEVKKVEPEPKKQQPVVQPEPTEVPVQQTTEETESISRKTSLTSTTTTVRKTSKSYQSSTTSWTATPPAPTAEEPAASEMSDGSVATATDTSDAEMGSPKTSRAPWRRQPSDANMVKTPSHLPEPESNPETLDITSSYGTGPMDEWGRPLFGLGALRRRPNNKPSNLSDDDGNNFPFSIQITQ